MLSGCGGSGKTADNVNTAETTGENTTEDTVKNNSPETEKTLTVAMELAYPPFETRDDAGEPTGISVDLMKAFGEYSGYDIRIENTSWDGLIPSLQTGAADIVISSMTITEERKGLVDFSDPYANALLAILANADSDIASIDDLNQSGKVVAVKSGSTGHMYAEKNLSEAKLLVLPDESACVTEVAQGRADGFIYDQLTIYRNWQNNPDTTSAVFIPFQDVEQWGIAVQKGNEELLSQLNAFLAEFQKNGGYEELTEKYLAEEKKAFDELNFQWFLDIKE
ncbi:MAG: transporter substrate-binding domain-containing protein [Lachnospiraceae bacterium]|nr:transporter substrate-binding domain-containing protein [Lachnospiraceae bacterium]